MCEHPEFQGVSEAAEIRRNAVDFPLDTFVALLRRKFGLMGRHRIGNYSLLHFAPLVSRALCNHCLVSVSVSLRTRLWSLRPLPYLNHEASVRRVTPLFFMQGAFGASFTR